jgi:hypothetical protein
VPEKYTAAFERISLFPVLAESVVVGLAKSKQGKFCTKSPSPFRPEPLT